MKHLLGTAFLLFQFILLSIFSLAQSDIVGSWTGTLYQNPTDKTPFTEYKFSMNLKEKEGEVAGVSTLITGPNFGIIDLTGQFLNETFTFEEYYVEKEKHTTNFNWCLKSGTLKLTRVGTQLKLEGKWTGHVMNGKTRTECGPGRIVLIKEQGFISIKGFVVNEKTIKPIPAYIKIVNKATMKEVAYLNTKTGEFDIKLPGGSEYEITVEAQDYLTRYQNIKLLSSSIINLPMKEIEAGQTVTLKSILFQKSTSILTADSYPELERFCHLLSSNPSVNIELQGHTSNEGDAAKNMTLAEERVNTIKNYLVTKGINPARIRTRAFGSEKPIAPNDTEENRKLNRRVEFLILNI
jgi:outer membrane protein OmpA-like peptidoglycan-associated protein